MPRTFEDVLTEWMQDPEFRAEYEATEPAYQLARLRIKRGLTQAELAEMIGTQQPSIARMEAGSNSETLMQRAAAALGARIVIVSIEETATEAQ